MFGRNEKKNFFVVNDPDFFLSHRLPIATAAREAGCTVHVATGAGKAVAKIKSVGLVNVGHPISPLSRKTCCGICFDALTPSHKN